MIVNAVSTENGAVISTGVTPLALVVRMISSSSKAKAASSPSDILGSAANCASLVPNPISAYRGLTALISQLRVPAAQGMPASEPGKKE